jgi:uncharacterized FlgJ-related protein
MTDPFKIFEEMGIGGSVKPKAEPDFAVAFSVWAEKQAFHDRLPANKSQKLTISAEQLLLLMREAYKAGYKRSKL